MGLDMYLNKKTYIGANYEHRNVKANIDITIDGKPVAINPQRVSYIIEQVGYWRKANQIHRWFVENVQDGEDDCRDYYVSSDQLKTLLRLCQRVLAECPLTPGEVTNGYTFTKEGGREAIIEQGMVMQNAELAAELLPTASGFFFGGTEYDQYYYEDIKDTVEMLTGLLEEDSDADYEYTSSW